MFFFLKLRPAKPRFSHIWDANIVLDFLSIFYPNEDIPLCQLTYKLVMLIALISAQRAQTLHKIYVSQIRICDDLVTIPIFDLLKQSRPNRAKFALKFKNFDKKPAVCVVCTLKAYLERTKYLRRQEDQLFISFCKPFGPVSKDTISRWLKSVLEEAGIDTAIFKAHSTRAASCSRAKKDCVPIDDILKTAGWSNKRTFEKFYDKVIID